jgi:hypothetical protein
MHGRAPGFLCGHGALCPPSLYLAPSLALAFLFWMLAGAHPAFFLLTAPGTLCHELAHFGVGLLTNAEPTPSACFRAARASSGNSARSPFPTCAGTTPRPPRWRRC